MSDYWLGIVWGFVAGTVGTLTLLAIIKAVHP